MAGQGRSESTYVGHLPAGLAVFAGAVVLAQVGTQLAFDGIGALSAWGTLLSVLLTTAFATPVFLGGLWLGRSEVDPARYRRVAAWCLGVGLVILAINVVMILTWPADTAAQNAGWAIQSLAMGAAGGIVFGGIEARAIERARAAERARVHADHLEAQREWLEYLNSLLRHEVLNTTNVIVGNAEIVLEDFDGEEGTRSRLERIASQSREMGEVIQDVRLLIDASKEDPELEPVDVVSVVEREAEALSDRHESATVDTSTPERAAVMADDLLQRALANLLDNAVEHNDAPEPRVDVEVRVEADRVRIDVVDDGPGVPPEERETLFQRSTGGDHGLGLYLVRTLVERYGGSVELTETGPGGSTFTIELPRADAGGEPARDDLSSPGSEGAASTETDGVADPLVPGQ